MIASAALILAGLAPALAAVNPITRQSRELSYAMRQLYEREAYTEVQAVPNPPACSMGYDTMDLNGQCSCGPGRVETDDGTKCEVANGGGSYNTVQLQEPQPITIPITWSEPHYGPADVMNAAQCGGICSEDAECIGYYLQPAANPSLQATCWELGNAFVYDSPPAPLAPPFTPSGGSRMPRRAAAGQTGSIGSAGGILATAGQTDPNNPSNGCNTQLGDQPSPSFSGQCTCGPGRGSNGNGGCMNLPSNGMRRLARRVNEQAQW